MDKKIENEKEEILPSETCFNDEDILNDVLVSLKHLTTEYGLLVQESSNKGLNKNVEQLAKEVGEMARDSFNLMFEKGWYSLECQDSNKLCEEYNKFNTKKEQFNN